MTDRDKVIEELKELCEYLFHEYKTCYHGDEEDTYNRFLSANNALNLLEEQEPKVLTAEELKQFDERPCWFESHGTYMGQKGFWIIPYMFTCYKTMYYVYPLMQINDRGDCHFSELGLSAYNKAWRCWSSRPTDEQREAVKWDD